MKTKKFLQPYLLSLHGYIAMGVDDVLPVYIHERDGRKCEVVMYNHSKTEIITSYAWIDEDDLTEFDADVQADLQDALDDYYWDITH